MKTYNCKVRLNGSLLNVVDKRGVTAAEIVLLRHIHGQSESANDPVTDIVAASDIKRSERDERARLGSMYSMGEKRGPQLVQELLGVGGVPLPQWVEGVDEPADEEAVEASDQPAPPTRPRRTKVAAEVAA